MGIIGPETMGWAIAFGVLLVVGGAIAFALRSRGRRRDRDQGRSGHRLSIVETREIDAERKLLIVRCDGVDHLVLIGGGSDLLIKADIQPAEVRVAFPAPISPAPSFAVTPVLPAEPAIPVTPAPPSFAPATFAPPPSPPAYAEAPFRPPVPPVAGRPEPPRPVPPSPELQAFAPPRATMAAAPVAARPEPVAPAPAPAPEPAPEAGAPAAQADFSEMTKKLEEALMRTAALRGPTPADRASASAVPPPPPVAAPVPAAERDASAPPVDPFEEEIRRLLGRDAPKT